MPAVLLCMLVLLWTPMGRADLLQEGSEAIRRGEPELAYELFSHAAEAGDPVGEYGLGVLFLHGTGVAPDPAWATHWFRAAAERGYAPAQLNLGNAYLYGRGVDRDLGAVDRWWRRAAHHGYAPAQFNLGHLLCRADAPAELREEGIAWLRAAARQGLAKADARLAGLGEAAEPPGAWADPEREPQRSEGRLMTLDPDGFTIQVLTARLSSTAESFVVRYGIEGRALVFRFPYEGRLWNSVVLGWYPSLEAAQRGAESLPEGLRRLKLWFRSVAGVQRQILAVRSANGITAPRPAVVD